jgi:MFS family permease
MVQQTADKLKSNIWIIYVINFLKGLMFFLPIYALYLQQELFTVFNVSLIIAIQAIFIALFEVPSGAIADLFGRKNTLIAAGIIAFMAVFFLSIGTTLIFFILYAILIALAESLNSGTDVAILFDSVKGANKQAKKEAIALSEASVESKAILSVFENKKAHFKRVIGINNSMWPIGASISSLIGGILAVQSLRLPIFVTLIPFGLALILTLFLTEPKYQREKHKNIFLHMFKSAKIVIKKKQLFILTLAGLLFFAFGEVTHQLNPIFFEFKAIPLEYFGLIFAIMFGLSSIGSFLSYTVSSKLGNKSTIIISAMFTPILTFAATLAFGLWAGLLLAIPSLFWGIRSPVITHLLNLEVTSKNRATVISIGNLGKRLGLAICIPIFGRLSDVYNINFVFKLAAGLYFSAIFVLFFIKDKN